MKTSILRIFAPAVLAAMLVGACSTSRQPEFPYQAISRDQLPHLARRSFDHLPADPILSRGPTFTITLKLGIRRQDPATRMYRTGSKYVITSADHLMWAESVFAQADRSDTGSDFNPSIDLFHDPDTGNWLIHEEHSWSIDRVILFQTGADGNRVRYLRIPRLPGGLPHLREYRIQGMHRGTLYIEKTGIIYTLPIESLSDERTLEYGFG